MPVELSSIYYNFCTKNANIAKTRADNDLACTRLQSIYENITRKMSCLKKSKWIMRTCHVFVTKMQILHRIEQIMTLDVLAFQVYMKICMTRKMSCQKKNWKSVNYEDMSSNDWKNSCQVHTCSILQKIFLMTYCIMCAFMQGPLKQMDVIALNGLGLW